MRTVYLLHFSIPLRGGAQHYVGQTERAVEVRLAEHVAGRGSRLTRRASAAGVAIRVARVWEEASTGLERELKRRGGFRRLCPLCDDRARGGATA